MKMTTKLFSVLLAAVMVLSLAGCGGPGATTQAVTEPARTETTKETAAPAAATEASTEAATEAPTEAQPETPEQLRSAVEAFLNMDLMNGLLQTHFDDPRNALLGPIAQQGDDFDPAVDYEKAFKENGRTLDGSRVCIVSEEHMDEFLMTAAGIKAMEITTNPGETYLNGYHCFAAQRGDVTTYPMEILRVDETADGRITVIYRSKGPESWVIWVRKNDGSWDCEYAPYLRVVLARTENGGFRVLKNHSLQRLAEEFMNTSPVNGFLMSAYADARDASLYEVLYQHKEAGVNAPEIMTKHGAEPEEGMGYRSITMEHLSEWTMKVTGYDAAGLYASAHRAAAFGNMTGINKVYFPDEQIFIMQAGDTNYQPAKISSFKMDDDGVFTVIYRSAEGYGWLYSFANDTGFGDSYTAQSMICRMKLGADGELKILSNRANEAGATDRSVAETELTMFFNRYSMVNGLLHSVYTDVRNAAFGEIIYQATDDQFIDRDTVLAAYAALGMSFDPNSGFSGIRDEVLDEFLLGVTGYHLEEFTDRDCGLHFDGYGFYGMQHGDSNFLPVVIDGVSQNADGTISVTYHSNWTSWLYQENGTYKHADQMKAVVVRAEEYWYHIISNQAVK